MCAAQDYKKPSQDPISKVVIHVVLFMSLLISNISFFVQMCTVVIPCLMI